MIQELIDTVQGRCHMRLGERVDEVRAVLNDCDYQIGVVIKAGKMRHAVMGVTQEAMVDPVAWADDASNKLMAWLDARDVR